MTKRKIKSISIPQEIYNKSMKKAEEEYKSWSQFVIDLIVNYLKKNK